MDSKFDFSSETSYSDTVCAQCPKCGAPRTDTACSKCGLVYEKFHPETLHKSVSPAIWELWKHVEAHWRDETAHAVFVEKALSADEAGFIASCYRAKGNDEIAEKQLEKLTGRLMQQLTVGATEKPSSNSGLRGILYVLMFLLTAALVFLIFVQTMK